MSRRKNILLARKFDAAALAKWPKPYILQPKINGRRALVYFDNNGYCSIRSSEDHEITSLPELKLQLDHSGLRNVILDGELYNHQWSFQKLCSVVGRTNNVHDEQKLVNYWCFDLASSSSQQARRLGELDALLDYATRNCPNLFAVPSIISDNIAHYLDAWTAMGFEGIIIRHKDGLYKPMSRLEMMKLKPRQSAIFMITGAEEAHDKYGQPKNELGALWLVTDDGEEFKVGSGFTSAQRQTIWHDDSPLNKCEIFYQELSERGVPIFPIFRRLI